MNFNKISKLFEKLEKTSKRLEKILILRDFMLANKEESPIIFDMIAGNYQREIDKKTIGISLKTIFSVISFLSKQQEKNIEKEFNKIGDIGEVAQNFLKTKTQSSLFTKDLTLQAIQKAYDDISKRTGTNANKIKKETLSKLFLSAKEPIEYKYLARLLIDDLRVGVSEGVLKEAVTNAYFPQIINIHLICEKCGYINLNLKECFNCKASLDTNYQHSLAQKKYQIVGLETPQKETSLLEYEVDYEINVIEFALRRDRNKQILEVIKPRELYNSFLQLFERKYNLINSFTKITKELDKSLNNVLNFEIIVGNPIRSMLGTRAQNVNQGFDMTSRPAILDFKYDGLRAQIHNNHGDVKIFTRNLDNITKQFPEVIKFIQTNFSNDEFVMDSECLGYDFEEQKFLPFQVLSKRILTKEIDTVSHINVAVKVFDILYLNGKTLIDEPYKKRREILEQFFLNKPLKQKLHFNIEKLKEIK